MAKKKKRSQKSLSKFTTDLIIIDKVMSPRHMVWVLLVVSLLANLAVGAAFRNSSDTSKDYASGLTKVSFVPNRACLLLDISGLQTRLGANVKNIDANGAYSAAVPDSSSLYNGLNTCSLNLVDSSTSKDGILTVTTLYLKTNAKAKNYAVSVLNPQHKWVLASAERGIYSFVDTDSAEAYAVKGSVVLKLTVTCPSSQASATDCSEAAQTEMGYLLAKADSLKGQNSLNPLY